MEEILASIRRIIADDQNAKAEEARPAPPPPENDDVLDLADVAQPFRKAPAPPPMEEAGFGGDDIDFDDISFGDEPEPPPRPAAMVEREPAPVFRPEPAPAPRSAAHMPAHVDSPPMERLVSDVTNASVAQAFSMLSHTVVGANALTLEDLVKDMLRPMLKGWLDENLPTLVERLVRAEIERVARGR